MLESHVLGHWRGFEGEGRPLPDATTGAEVARIPLSGPDFGEVLGYARQVGGPALRALGFHQRAAILKDLGKFLRGHLDEFHALSTRTGATKRDSTVDVDGGIGVLFVYGGKGARELPERGLLADGGPEQVGKNGTFAVQHVYTPLTGAAVEINAFNFPVWGMLEKFAPAFLAGVPSVVKPASQTAYLTELVVRRIVESGLLPEGALQLVCAPPGDLADHLTGQDLLSVTGSAATAAALRAHPVVAGNAVRFTAEADSLNCSVLGPDARPGTPEFDLYVGQLVTEMTVKAGQKCTAIRRALVPRAVIEDVIGAVTAKLAEIHVGDPADDSVHMGPLASLSQRDEVRRALKTLTGEAQLVHGNPDAFGLSGANAENGGFLPPLLLRADPDARAPHAVEAFGPVSTVLPYDGPAHAVELAARGAGSLAGSVVSHDAAFVSAVGGGLAPWHGRLLLLNRDNAGESTGHGSPLPHTVHGGPGRAGGGEELGGIRAVLHHMQRTALQGSPEVLRAVVSP
ncbi:phenylacetic acid degradation bifunctional protein PaaZ [Amycolatopsis acidicola]|uniref:Phenylacetic acid degradation bifunctional protein PaaZ n=2 Tax=Amycolatopsis acidicola TaxID=2596893 RepID=A0A5N0VIM0_9PSEU|nr:phenylacetic acid degradation bifunctional protein PaaZ [Amycolatopsis acidicola]